MAQIDLSKVNARLKSRENRPHQNVPLEAKKVAGLKRETIKLEAQAREVKGQPEKLKRGGEKLGIKTPAPPLAAAAKPAPTKAQDSKKALSGEPEVFRLAVRNGQNFVGKR